MFILQILGETSWNLILISFKVNYGFYRITGLRIGITKSILSSFHVPQHFKNNYEKLMLNARIEKSNAEKSISYAMET